MVFHRPNIHGGVLCIEWPHTDTLGTLVTKGVQPLALNATHLGEKIDTKHFIPNGL